MEFDVACWAGKCGGDSWYVGLYQTNIRATVKPSMSKVGQGRCMEGASLELCFLHDAQMEDAPLMRHFHLV